MVWCSSQLGGCVSAVEWWMGDQYHHHTEDRSRTLLMATRSGGCWYVCWRQVGREQKVNVVVWGEQGRVAVVCE